MGVSAFHRSYWDGRAYRRTKIYQQDHTFLFGDVVRWDGATQKWVLASADLAQNAEALGVVSHSGYRGADNTASTLDYSLRALPSYEFDHRTQTEESCNNPRHYFSIVFRGEITIPDALDIDYSQHALLTGTDSVREQYTPGGVYYLSPFPNEVGKLIRKSPLEFGGVLATTVVKPMLVALDHRRAVVVNYIGSKLESLPEEWINIQDVQKVGAVGAFLESTVPDSWIPCDGRLCNTSQYPQLAEAIGGSVRVAATLTLEGDAPQADTFTGIEGYCILDFTGENIDVSAAVLQEPLNIKLQSSSGSGEVAAIIDSIIDNNRLRVIVDRSAPPEGLTEYQVGQAIQVKVRAPYIPGIDRQFFVPNLRSRTLRGADPYAVFEGSNIQSDAGDYSGSNTNPLDLGGDIQSGTGYSATVDVRADALKVIFAIKALAVDCGTFINDCCAPLNPVGLNDNAIINGAFLVWQRGKEFSRQTFDAQPEYTADRWFEDFSVSPPIQPPLTGTYHVLKKGVKRTHFNPASMVVPLDPGTVVAPGARAEELPDDITTYAQFQGTLMTANRPHGSPTTTYWPSVALVTGVDYESYHYLENRIEDVRTFSGERVTLSFWARGTDPGDIYVTLRQHFAGNRGILDDAYSTPVKVTLDGSANWNRYEIVLDIPDVQDTKPADGYLGGNNFLGVQFWTMYFAGGCTGTPNPNVYDTVATTPGPEDNNLPLPPQPIGAGAGCPDGCKLYQAVRTYMKCAESAGCTPCGACGTSASIVSCCTTLVVEYGETICVGTGCGGSLNTCPGGFGASDPKMCSAPSDLWIESNACCLPLPGSYPCFGGSQDNPPPPGTCPNPICAAAIKNNNCQTGSNPGGSNPSAFCNATFGGNTAAQSALQSGGCGCSGSGVANGNAAATAAALCACCACQSPPNTWGCAGGVDPSPIVSATASPAPSPQASVAATASPSPGITILVSQTRTPAPSNTPAVSTSPSASIPATATPSVTVTRTITPTPTVTKSLTPTPTPTRSNPPSVTPSPVTPTPSPTQVIKHECVTNCCLPVLFDSDFNYTGVVHLTGVQLLRGNAAVPFEETDYLDELKKCQRYYETDRFIPIGGMTKNGQNGEFIDSINYMVQKRKLRQPCVHIQGHYEPDLVTGCTLDTIEVDCFNTESAVLHLTATPTQSTLGLCAAYVEYEVDADLYESPCPADPYTGTTFACGWEGVS